MYVCEWIILKVSCDTKNFTFHTAQQAVHILLTTLSICCFQDAVLSIINPRNFVVVAL